MKDMIRDRAARVADRVAPRATAAVRDRRAHAAAREQEQGPAGKDLAQQVARLRRRIVVLEREVQENRRLNRRIAELTDVVQELLLPVDKRDDDKLRARLDIYGKGL